MPSTATRVIINPPMAAVSTPRNSRSNVPERGKANERIPARSLGSSLTYQYVVNVNAVSWSNMLKYAGRSFIENSPMKYPNATSSAIPPSPTLRKPTQTNVTLDSPRFSEYSWKRREERKPGPTQAADRPYRHSLEFTDLIVAQNEPEEPVRRKEVCLPKISTNQMTAYKEKHPAAHSQLEQLYDKLHRSRIKDKNQLIKKLNLQIPAAQGRQFPKVVPYFYQRLRKSLDAPDLTSCQLDQYDDTELDTSRIKRPLTSEKGRYRPSTGDIESVDLQKLFYHSVKRSEPTPRKTLTTQQENRKQYRSAESFNRIMTSSLLRQSANQDVDNNTQGEQLCPVSRTRCVMSRTPLPSPECKPEREEAIPRSEELWEESTPNEV